jgi:predicted dehydrogenase
MSDLKIAIIGAGKLATRRIYPYIGAAGGQLVGVCDLDAAKAETNARRFGGRHYTELERMLATEKPDAVIVCIGPTQHAQLAPAIMRMGYPVYTEKPPAATALEAYSVARVSAETGMLCSTAFKKRYSIAYSRAKQWIAMQPPDSLYSISVDYASAQYANTNARNDFLLDFAIHLIDLSLYLLGDAKEVFCFAKGKDAYAVSVKFMNGAVGSFQFNCGRSFTVPTEEMELTARGGNFMTIHNSSVWRITENGQPKEWREPPTFISSGDSGNDTGHLAEIADFFEAIKSNRTTRSNIYEGYKSMVFYEAIKQSAETESVVQIRNLDNPQMKEA